MKNIKLSLQTKIKCGKADQNVETAPHTVKFWC